MNVNRTLIGLKDVTGFPVYPDVYEGTADKYITFTYEDERGALYADDEEIHTEVTVEVNLFTPKDFNYFQAKDAIKAYLVANDFQVENIQSWISTEEKGTSKYRQTTFSANKTQ